MRQAQKAQSHSLPLKVAPTSLVPPKSHENDNCLHFKHAVVAANKIGRDEQLDWHLILGVKCVAVVFVEGLVVPQPLLWIKVLQSLFNNACPGKVEHLSHLMA